MVFVDSSAFYAVIDRDDRNHVHADASQASLAAAHSTLLTSNFMVAECHALILRRLGHRAALTFLEQMEFQRFEVVRVEIEDERRAVEIIRQYDDKNFSYVDASSFAVMERLGIQDVFSFDRHFVQYGFASLQDALT